MLKPRRLVDVFCLGWLSANMAVLLACSAGFGCDNDPTDEAPAEQELAAGTSEGTERSPSDLPGSDNIAEGTGTQQVAENGDPDPEVVQLPEDPLVALLEGIEIDLGDAEFDPEIQRLVQTTDDGLRLVLTVNPNLQEHLTSVVSRYDEPAEAVVAIEPATGRVLAWVGDVSELSPVDDPLVSAAPYAASIFKLITATALIEGEGYPPNRVLCIPEARRSIELEHLTYDPDSDELCIDMVEAMAESRNAYFARASNDHLSVEDLSTWTDRFMFNQQIPFQIEIETSHASIPEDRLERARMSAGFRYSHLSPLHGALIAATVANDGTMMAPTLIEQIIDASSEVVYSHEPTVLRVVFNASTARLLTEVMSQTTLTGTAARYFADREGWPADLLVAGKTGTLTNRSEEGPDPDPLLTYSWFVGFAPIDDPTIATAGLVYNTPSWYIKGSYLASEAVITHHRQQTP